MRRSTLISLALATGALVATVTPTVAKPPPPCAPGRFLLGAAALPFASSGTSYVPLIFSTSSNPKKPGVSLGTCGGGKTRVYKGTKAGTKLQLFWPSCGTKKKVLVAGSIGADCKSLQVSVKAKKTPKTSVGGSLATGCGDGLVDAGAGETCEGTTGCGPGEECSSCHCQPVPTTTTTAPTVTTTTGATVTTTTTTTSTTSTTVPSLCTNGVRNGIVDGVEECDDGNDVADDGCTNSCTKCGNMTITPPEACDDGNLTCGDGCDGACRIEACGNGIIDCGETCDDGDLNDDNACPANCVIQSCSPDTASSRLVTVSFTPPTGSAVAALVVLLDYPEGKVNIIGSGAGAAPSVTTIPSGVSSAVNDLDHKVRVVVAKSTPFQSIAPGALFRVDFKNCDGAQNPNIDEFPCKVVSASSPTGADVGGVTCTASM
jgi:cysteine-rich repeat protein